VRHVALGHFDQVRDLVVPARELHVDLRDGVLERIAGGDEPVVDADRPQGRDDRQGQQNHKHDHLVLPLFSTPREVAG
jgi:hypothetical protein